MQRRRSSNSAELESVVHARTDALTIIHVPLAMAIMGVAAWLSLQAGTDPHTH